MKNKKLIIHIILLFLTAGIGNVIYLLLDSKTNKEVSSNSYVNDQYIDNVIQRTEEYEKIDTKYKYYINKHYDILENVRELYSKAINSDNIFNSFSEECVKLCYDDLAIAPNIIEWQKELCKIQEKDYIPLNYGTHKYLINILIKQNKYTEALDVCNKYINLDLIDDGTKGGIIERKNKIIKLLNK